MALAIGFILALLIGAGCRWLSIPVPAPPNLIGVALVAAITVGYIIADRFLGQ